jgi:hypothetical protein
MAVHFRGFHLAVGGLGALLVGTALCVALADEIDQFRQTCDNLKADPDDRIPACTRLLESGRKEFDVAAGVVGAELGVNPPRSAPIVSEGDRRRIGMEDRVELAGSQHSAIPGARLEGAANPNLRTEVLVILKRRAVPPEIGPNTPTLSREELTRLYGADPAQIARIEAFARDAGLQVLSASAETRTVQLAGTVAQMEAAFGVKLLKANIAGHEFRYQEGPVLLPRSVADGVTAVLGLDDRPTAAPR